MLPYSVVFPITKNYGFYGVKDNKLVTGDNLKSLEKFFNHERAKSIKEGNRLDCDINNWEVDDWYAKNPCIEQRNTSHLEKALEIYFSSGEEVKPDKFPIFFGSRNMASLLNQLLFSEENKKNSKENGNNYYKTDFNFNPETGLRFIVPKKVDCSEVEKVDRSVVGQHGHIVERFVTSEENVDRSTLQNIPIEIGRNLTYLMNSLEFPDSDVILFSSKEFDCFWDQNDLRRNAKNACEVKAYSNLSEIRKKELVVKNFGLGRIRRLAMFPPEENFNTISNFEVKDIETLNENQTLESFYACLNNFTKLMRRHCQKNLPTEGFLAGTIKTYQRDYGRFMIIEDEEHFWFYEYKIDSKNFSDGLQLPKSLTAIRWPLANSYTRFDFKKIPDIQKYSFYGQDPDRVLHHVEGNCLLVVRKNNELANDLASKFKYKMSKENPIFPLVEEVLLQRYLLKNEKKSQISNKRSNNYEAPNHLDNKRWRT